MKAWLVMGIVVLVGCSFDSPETQTIENSCSNDASCSQGVCNGDICIDDSGASVEIAIEVLRGSSDVQSATPASWAIGPESFSRAGTRDIVLPATREVRGVVRWDGLRVPATLRFVRRMQGAVAPLTPVPVEVDTLREAADPEGPDAYDFSTVLVAGETYDVVVLPSSDMVMTPTEASAPAIRSLPPLYLELAVADGDSNDPSRFDVAFPANLADSCADNIVVGCTLEAVVLSVEGELVLPEAGLQTRAIDKKTGRVVSSVGETDEYGRFAIRIGETTSDYLIRVTSSASGDPFPSVSVDPELVFSGEPIKIPRLEPVQFSGRVRDTNDSPVPGATVRFLSIGIFGGTELGLEGSFGGSATTNEDGIFGAELLLGVYSITVTPPEDVDNTWGVLFAERPVGGEGTPTEDLIVPSQIGFGGLVTTFRDEPAAGVTILAGARQTEDLGAIHRSQEAVSDDLGAFAMSVDSGLYDMHVKMSSETGFAWLVEPELVMSAELGDLERGYRLDPPIPVRGVIRSGDGDIEPDALVRAYVFMTAEGAASRPIQVAETVSSEDGSYRLLIDPRLGGE